MKLFCLSILSILITAPLISYLTPDGKLPDDPKYDIERNLDKVVDTHLKFIQETRGWTVSCLGGGIPNKKITNVSVGYHIIGPSTIEEARQLIIPAAEDLLARINSADEISDYLIKKPFDSENISYSVSFVGSNHLKIKSPDFPNSYNSIAHVLITNEKISYLIAKDSKSPLETVFEEPYEEAKRLLETESDKG